MLIFFRKIKRLRKMTRGRQGKAFESMTSNGLRRLVNQSKGEFWFHRLFDYKTFIAINPKLVCIKQPADYIALNKGRFYLIECKSSTMPRYDLKNVKPHQEENMTLIERAGGYFWLLILHRKRNSRDHELYALSPKAWECVKTETRKSGYVSASWDTISKYANFKINRNSNVYDFTPLFQTEQSTLMCAPQRYYFRKKYITNARKRDTRFIMMKEFPGVAFYDAETEEILIITDLWFYKCVEAWRHVQKCGQKVCKKCSLRNKICAENFSKYVTQDMLISQVHELEHYCTEPLAITGLDLTLFETAVEHVAEDLVKKGKTAWCPNFEVQEHGGLKLA